MSVPGLTAQRPTEIPPRGWFQIIKRAWAEAKRDQIPLLSAGVAFWAFLSLFPAMIAAVTLYGLFADPETVLAHAQDLTRLLPADAASLITDQLTAIATADSGTLGVSLVVSLAAALWSASGGVGNLVEAINIAYDEEETRGFVKRKALALGLTGAAIVFAVLSLGLIAVLPVVLDEIVPSQAAQVLVQVARWGGLFLVISLALSTLYRFAPDRAKPRFSWVSVGALVSTLIWLTASVGFSLYVNNFGSYNKTYGALAGVIVALLWLFITVYVVLLGAEINAEAEQQTARDTTTGEPRPMGQRDAVKADSLPGDNPDLPHEDPQATWEAGASPQTEQGDPAEDDPILRFRKKVLARITDRGRRTDDQP